MFGRTLFRAPGYHAFQLIVAISLALISSVGCSPDSKLTKVDDAWSLTPPTIVTANEKVPLSLIDAKTAARQLKSPESISPKTFPIDTHIAFAPIDQNLRFEYRADCANEIRSGESLTSEAVHFVSLLPELAVHRSIYGEGPQKCSIQFKVHSSSGSTHSFSLNQIQFSASLEERERNAESFSAPVGVRFKLLCGSWWAQEDPAAVNISLPQNIRISHLSMGPVLGSDIRRTQWNPDCALFGIDRNQREHYLGRLFPLKNSRRLEVEEKILLNPSTIGLSTVQTLAHWRATNSSPFPQTIRIKGQPNKLRLAVILTTQPFLNWGRPVSLRIATAVSAIRQEKLKVFGDEIYVHLQPSESADVTIKILTTAFCPHGKMFAGQPALRIQTEQPVQLEQTEASIDLQQFAVASESTLRALKVVKTQTLIHLTDLSTDTSKNFFTRLNQAGTTDFQLDTSAAPSCIGGDPFGSFTTALPQ